MESFSIGDHMIGTDAPVFIIAEIGINHGGREEECARLIELDYTAGKIHVWSTAGSPI